jgi:RNA polymerase sigma-70 factor (ECF subfamily)
MRWKTGSIRQALGFPRNGEAELLSAAGRGRQEPGTPILADSGLSSADFLSLAANFGPGTTGQPTKRIASEDSGAENEDCAQPSGADGVAENMATLVLDNSALGVGADSQRNARPEADRGLRNGQSVEADKAGALRHDSAEAGQAAPVKIEPVGDAAVMLRAAAGDEASFNYLVERYHRPMIHFLFRMVQNQAIAEELAQEVFFRVYRSRESYRAEAKFTTWLYRIATNLAVNYARDTQHERAARIVYLDTPDEETGTTPEVADDEPSVEERLLREERMKAIRIHVMDLPERQRMAVVMHKYQGMDYREIGQVLKLSESATKSLLFRAYQTLREKLKDFI